MIMCELDRWHIAVKTGHQFTVKEIETALENAYREFMSPDVDYLTADEALKYTGEDEPGWYWRLSADGYFDCTDRSGPFGSEVDAVADMLMTYGDDWLPATLEDWRESMDEEE